jgi:Trk-type K+ transport system membrane component
MGLYLLIPMFIVVLASTLIVSAGAIALRMTGIDEKTARFQALSAFTRAGFTTRESELIVNHPQRRSIITWLIILGNAGIVAVIVTATSSITTSLNYRLAINMGLLIAGLYLMYRLVRHTGLTRRWENLVMNRVFKGRSFVHVPPVQHLLRLAGDYGVARVIVSRKSPLSGFAVNKGPLPVPDAIVLGIEHAGKWVPGQHIEEPVDAGDTVIIYGRLTAIEESFGIFNKRS